MRAADDVDKQGIVYIAYGEPARREAAKSIQTLRERHVLDVTVISDVRLPGTRWVKAEDRDPGARWVKVNLDLLTPYGRTLYLDADTRVYGKVNAGFDMLADGWEMVMTASGRQKEDFLWHLGAEDRDATMRMFGNWALQLQGGMIFFRKCDAIRRLFAAWRREWLRFRGQDQGALLRALHENPMRLWLLGRPWNGGAIITHNFGRAKRSPRIM